MEEKKTNTENTAAEQKEKNGRKKSRSSLPLQPYFSPYVLPLHP